eukprot:g2610.t1
MSTARIRLDSFDVKKLDPAVVLRFNIKQQRRGARSFLPGYATRRLAVLHLTELTLNIADAKGANLGAKSYRSDRITRVKRTGDRNLVIHMQREEGAEQVKEYQFNDAKARKVFIDVLDIMNRYGTVVNHLYEEHFSSDARKKEGSRDAGDVVQSLTGAIEKYMGLYISKRKVADLCGPEIKTSPITLRQLFHIVAAADMPDSSASEVDSSSMDASARSKTTKPGLKKKSSIIETSRKRIVSAVEFRDGEEIDDVRILHGRASLQWQRLVDGIVQRVYISGSLALTPFRLVFVAHSKHIRERRMSQYLKSAFLVSMPMTTVVSIDADRSGVGIVVKMKDFRVVVLKLNASAEAVKQIVEEVRKQLYFEHDLKSDRRGTARTYCRRLFAFRPRSDNEDGIGLSTGWIRFGEYSSSRRDDTESNLTWLQREYRRLGLIRSAAAASSSSPLSQPKFREFLNQKHSIVPTYPKYICVPSKFHMPDHELFQALEFRSKKRLPAITWCHPRNRTLLVRSAQPLVGINGKHDASDEKLVDLYRKLGSSHGVGHEDSSLTIVDCRRLIAAQANYARGGGYENVSRYKKCEMYFCNIDNIHIMRSSVTKLANACAAELTTAENDDEDWLQNLFSTRWLKYVSRVLSAGIHVARMLHCQKRSVICHCSDGWDRTSQVCAIAEILLDPYYRTITGFGVLVEKDWCSFGHKFHDRIGHGQKPELKGEDSGAFFPTKECSPVFLQFIEAVAQIQRQMPNVFEFNSDFLLFLVDASYSCEFGNFLCNNERERVILDVYRKTTSVWDYVAAERRLFTNTSYEQEPDVIWPSPFMQYDWIGGAASGGYQRNLATQHICEDDAETARDGDAAPSGSRAAEGSSDDDIRQFVEITNVNTETARFYLDMSDGDVMSAVAQYYAGGAEEADRNFVTEREGPIQPLMRPLRDMTAAIEELASDASKRTEEDVMIPLLSDSQDSLTTSDYTWTRVGASWDRLADDARRNRKDIPSSSLSSLSNPEKRHRHVSRIQRLFADVASFAKIDRSFVLSSLLNMRSEVRDIVHRNKLSAASLPFPVRSPQRKQKTTRDSLLAVVTAVARDFDASSLDALRESQTHAFGFLLYTSDGLDVLPELISTLGAKVRAESSPFKSDASEILSNLLRAVLRWRKDCSPLGDASSWRGEVLSDANDDDYNDDIDHQRRPRFRRRKTKAMSAVRSVANVAILPTSMAVGDTKEAPERFVESSANARKRKRPGLSSVGAPEDSSSKFSRRHRRENSRHRTPDEPLAAMILELSTCMRRHFLEPNVERTFPAVLSRFLVVAILAYTLPRATNRGHPDAKTICEELATDISTSVFRDVFG